MTQATTIVGVLAAASPVMPVVTVHRLRDAAPLASALTQGGISVVEVTLRTSCALDVITAMKTVPGLCVGAGTVTHEKQFPDLVAAGADFAVSPGMTAGLLNAAQGADVPYMPGIATASDILEAMAFGVSACKFFPASVAGGTAMLRAFQGPFPTLRFCPTGGVTEESFRDYLALDNVPCVGGGWITPDSMIAAGDWPGITALARSCRL